MAVRIGNVETFPDVEANKAQALKVLEEAAELVEAYKDWERCCGRPSIEQPEHLRLLTDECADVIQATCNLLDGLRIENFKPYMDRCKLRNKARGRM